MATPAQPAAQSNLPFSEELGLVNYLRQATGTQSVDASKSYKASQATAAQAPLITEAGLSGIMTDFLRTNGQFLQNMNQQNQSGLYNSSTRRLVANDLTAQAALKAATANQNIGVQNAQLQTNVAIENARNGSRASEFSAKSKGQKGTDQLLNLLMAAGVNKFRGDSEKDAKKTSKGQQAERASTATAAGADITESFATPESAGSFGPQSDYGYDSYAAPDTSGSAWAAEPFDVSQMIQSGGSDFSGMSDGFSFDTNVGSGNVYDIPSTDWGYQDYSNFDIGTGGGDSGGGSSFDFGDLGDWSEW